MRSRHMLDWYNELEDDGERAVQAAGHYTVESLAAFFPEGTAPPATRKLKKIAKGETGKAGEKEGVKKLLRAYKTYLSDQITKERLDLLPAIYASDGVKILSQGDKFVKPNISMFYEVLPVIDPPGADDQGDKFEFGFKFDKDAEKKNADGYKREKSVLRVHIFDEEAVSDPTTAVLGSVIYEGETGSVVNTFCKQVGIHLC